MSVHLNKNVRFGLYICYEDSMDGVDEVVDSEIKCNDSDWLQIRKWGGTVDRETIFNLKE